MNDHDPHGNTLTGLSQAVETASRRIAEAFADLNFQLTAQGTLGSLLRGDELQTHLDQRLRHLTTHQLERINGAARELTSITNGILEDREAAADSSTGRAGGPAQSGGPT